MVPFLSTIYNDNETFFRGRQCGNRQDSLYSDFYVKSFLEKCKIGSFAILEPSRNESFWGVEFIRFLYLSAMPILVNTSKVLYSIEVRAHFGLIETMFFDLHSPFLGPQIILGRLFHKEIINDHCSFKTIISVF